MGIASVFLLNLDHNITNQWFGYKIGLVGSGVTLVSQDV
jgi:hypothetical protein